MLLKRTIIPQKNPIEFIQPNPTFCLQSKKNWRVYSITLDLKGIKIPGNHNIWKYFFRFGLNIFLPVTA